MNCCGRDSEDLENEELKQFCFPLEHPDAVSPMGVGEEKSYLVLIIINTNMHAYFAISASQGSH